MIFHLIAITGGLCGLAAIFYSFYAFCKWLFWLPSNVTDTEFIKIKDEYDQGSACVRFSSDGVFTRCAFRYSSGSFTTTLNPLTFAGDLEFRDVQIENEGEINMQRLAKKCHRWAMYNTNRDKE